MAVVVVVVTEKKEVWRRPRRPCSDCDDAASIHRVRIYIRTRRCARGGAAKAIVGVAVLGFVFVVVAVHSRDPHSLGSSNNSPREHYDQCNTPFQFSRHLVHYFRYYSRFRGATWRIYVRAHNKSRNREINGSVQCPEMENEFL